MMIILGNNTPRRLNTARDQEDHWLRVVYHNWERTGCQTYNRLRLGLSNQSTHLRCTRRDLTTLTGCQAPPAYKPIANCCIANAVIVIFVGLLYSKIYFTVSCNLRVFYYTLSQSPSDFQISSGWFRVKFLLLGIFLGIADLRPFLLG